MAGVPVREVKRFRDEQGQKYEVPLDELDAFTQEMAGTKLERVNQVKAGGQLFEVPESEAGEFMSFYNSDAQFEEDRQKSAMEAASKLDAEDSPFMAGVKGFFSGDDYLEKASAGAANVLRGVAQAPATIADKVMAAEQFSSRVRNLPVVGKAIGMNPMLNPAGPWGMAAEAVTELFSAARENPATMQGGSNTKADGGKSWREMVGKARTYIDDWREKNLGFRNEQGAAPTETGDWLLTLGGQAANSVTEAYALSAPSFMQKANKAISLGKFSPTIQTLLYGASTAEDTAGKAEKAGRSEAEAVALGALTGTLESALESVTQVFGLQKTMGAEPVKKALGRMILRRAMDAVGEGATEGAQEFQKGAIEKLSKIDEKTWTEIGLQSAQAAAAGLLSGGASEISQASLAGIDTLQQRRQANELRADEEAAAVGLGRVAQQESVLEGDPAAAPQGEGAFQGQGPVAGGAVGGEGQQQGAGLDGDPAVAGADRRGNEGGTGLDGDPAVAGGDRRDSEGGTGLEDGLVELGPVAQGPTGTADFRTAGERMAQAQPLDLGRGVQAQGIVRIGRKDGKGKGIESVKLLLPNGRPFYSEDPGLMALTRYWYQDRVLFPPAPAGDRGAQEGDVALNISRRLGYVVNPGKTVLVNVGKSKKAYMGHIVQVLDNNTVRVMIDKTQRSLGNNRAGYADVDIRQIAQLNSVIGKQRREALMAGMPKEQKDRINEQARAFDQELIDQGYFLNQESWMEADAMPGKTGRKAKDAERAAAYRRAAQSLGVPLDNHIQRAAALELLQDFHAGMQGTEVGIPYDALQEQLAREAEQEMQDRRASGEFSLADMTPEEMAAADANLEAQRVAQEARRKMLARAAAPLEGDAGDLTGELFGAFDDTPLFGGAADAAGNLKLETGNLDDSRPTDELFNMDIPSQAKGRAYNQDESGGAETPTAQETRVSLEDKELVGPQQRYAVGMDLMDAVQMFYVLRGKMPKIRERMREGVMGLFKPGTQDIELLAGMFGMYDQADSDRIRAALEKKGFTGAKLEAQTDIEVRALIEKRRTENMKKPLKVMVHELSHYLDFLPDNIVRERGNILGHIAALKKHFKQAIGPMPGAPGPLTDAEKARIRTAAESEMKKKLGEARVEIDTITREVPEYAVLGIKPEDVKGLLGIDGRTETPELYDWFSRQDSATKRQVLMAAMKGVIDERMAALGSRVQTGTKTVTEQVSRNVKGYTKEDGRKRFRELLKQETEKRRLIELEQIKTEAYQIIPWWRGTPGIENHFTKPEEMYAELFAIFLADPSELRARAPTVYGAFAGWMDARPEVAKAYNDYLDFRNLPAEQQAKQKILIIKRGMNKEDEAARREAVELARKPGRWAGLDSFGYYFHRRTAPIKWALDRSLRVLVDSAQGDAAKAQVRDIYETALVGIKRQSAISRVIQNYEADINSRVAKPLQDLGFDMVDLGVYQKLRRVAYELDGKAATAGLEPASALKLLDHLRQEYGEERWQALQKYAMEFRRIREARIIQNPDLRAMYDKELLSKLDSNVEYVTFQRVPTMEEIKQFKEAIRKAKSGDKLLREDVAEFLTREMESRLGSAVGSKIFKYVGSFGPTANPIVATLSKDDQLIRAATRNTLKRQIYEFVKESGLDLIRDVQYEKSGQGVMVPRMVDDPNWKTVVYMQDGQVKGFLANRSLAKALESGRTDEIVALRRVMRANSFITKTYTQLKYSFSFMNNIRDLERAANYVPGMQRMNLGGININFVPGGGMISTLMRYGIPQAAARKILPKFMFNDKMIEWHLPQARRAAILIQNNTINEAEAQAQELLRMGETQQANKLFDDVRLAREGLENPILMSHIEAIREDSQADDYQRRLYKYGIQKEDLGNGLKAAAYLTGLFKGGARRVEAWGEVGELTTKLATWKYLETHGQGMSQQQKILITRELGGSPDFSERSAAASYIEAITSPFVNAAKEGTLGTLTALKNNPGETSRKLLTNVVAPTMVRHLLGSGLGLALLKIAIPDDDEREGMWLYNFMAWYYNSMKNVPNYIMKNYHSYPVPVATQKGSNFTAILRMPMDQTSQVLSLTVWNSMDALGEGLLNQLNSGNPNAAPAVIGRTERPGLETAKAFISSVGPDALGQAPILGMMGLVTGFLSGSNYYDSFKESDVFNEDELIARFEKPNAAKVLAGEAFNRMGGAMVKRYNSWNIFGEELPTLGKLLNSPFVQPTIGTFFNVYTGGQAQMERKLKRIEKEFEAPVKVEAKNDFARALKEGNGKGLNISEDIAAKMTAKEGGTYADLVKAQLYAEEFSRLNQEWQRNKAIRENVGVPLFNASKEDNPIMRDIRIDIMDRAPVRPILD
jgi:hypothetical protein